LAVTRKDVIQSPLSLAAIVTPAILTLDLIGTALIGVTADVDGLFPIGLFSHVCQIQEQVQLDC